MERLNRRNDKSPSPSCQYPRLRVDLKYQPIKLIATIPSFIAVEPEAKWAGLWPWVTQVAEDSWRRGKGSQVQGWDLAEPKLNKLEGYAEALNRTRLSISTPG